MTICLIVDWAGLSEDMTLGLALDLSHLGEEIELKNGVSLHAVTSFFSLL